MSILNVEHLSHGFGDRAIFQDVSFRLLKGEHIGLIGANGEGKSTFMNIITGHMQPDEGKVEWSKRVRVGYLDQHTVLEKGMTIRAKVTILSSVTLLMGLGFALMLRKGLWIPCTILGVIWICHLIYFLLGVKTLRAKD